MNAKKYVEMEKEIFKTPQEWAKNQINEYEKAFEDGDVEEKDEDYLKELKNVTLWGEVEDIANRYII